MTALVTSGGHVIDVSPGTPVMTTESGFRALGASSVPFIGGRTVSFARIYREQLWVAVAVNKLARQVARLPLKVYERNGNDRQRVRSGDLVNLLSRPLGPDGLSGRRAGPIQLKQWLMAPALVHGNALVAKGRPSPGAPPTTLTPVPWPAVDAKYDRDGQLEMWSVAQRHGGPAPLDLSEAVHIAWEPPDGCLGVSPLTQLGVTLRIENAAQRHQEASMRNGARPPSAITIEREFLGLEPAERQELLANLRADVEAIYGGPENAGRPAILPPGLDWKGIGHTAKEAELIEQRRLTREEVAAVFDVPPPLIGILDHATYSNVGEMHRMLFTTVLGPWITLIEESLQAQLVDPEPAFAGHFIEFDLSEVLRGDLLSEINALKTAVTNGLMTINEARAVRNLPPVDNDVCDQPLIPSNNLRPVGGDNDLDEFSLAAQRLGQAIRNGVVSQEEAREMLGIAGDPPPNPNEPAAADEPAVDRRLVPALLDASPQLAGQLLNHT